MSKCLVVAITGASGALYAQRFLTQAVHHFEEIYLILSSNAVSVLKTELGLELDAYLLDPKITLCEKRNFFTPPASGSFRHEGMVIVPCSMGTAGRIANGISDDLTTRAADVCLKEGRKLILVPREMPWNLIHLRNMTQLAEAGATILPASPAFYHEPKTIEDLVDTVVARILQNLGIEQTLVSEWQK
ncbi:UbiX family flavin prenyltransferase [Armatimonas sp.]|uniref:UbiX family flavin prenyltransferase n=1 Tax=Armatimonas sp. TaxID=1872638 RepID=UPI00375097F4